MGAALAKSCAPVLGDCFEARPRASPRMPMRRAGLPHYASMPNMSNPTPALRSSMSMYHRSPHAQQHYYYQTQQQQLLAQRHPYYYQQFATTTPSHSNSSTPMTTPTATPRGQRHRHHHGHHTSSRQRRSQSHSHRRKRRDSRTSTCSSSSGSDSEAVVTPMKLHPAQQQQQKQKRHARHSLQSSSTLSTSASTTASVQQFAPSPSDFDTLSEADSFFGTPYQQQQQQMVMMTPTERGPCSRRGSSGAGHHLQSLLSMMSTPPTSASDLIAPLYTLEEQIGKGTTSKCYQCRRQSDGRVFACKVVNKLELGGDLHRREEVTRQLRREMDVLRRLDHPNIAKLEDSFENESFLVLVMELLGGGELFDTIVDHGHLQEHEAMEVARDVLSAVQYMHALGIVHRDIKPENLLLVSSSGSGSGLASLQVKLIDFGFAKTLENSASTMSSFLGTAGYIAPEILLHQHYTETVDMWAVGVLLYLMLCGRLPFTTAMQIQPQQRVTAVYRLTFPDKYWHGVSEEAKDLVRQILVLNPRQRLTAEEALAHPWLQDVNGYTPRLSLIA